MKRYLVIFLPLVLFAGFPLAWGQDESDEKAGRPEAEDSAAGGGETDNQSPVDPARFGKALDKAFGAYQRGHYLTALEHARPRAQAGDPAAQTLIAEIYARGLGVPRSAEKAAEWYAKAAEQGVPEAQMQYALILADGEFAERDRDRAFSLMRSAARAGETMAQFNLAQMLLESGSEDEAVKWYERAAEAGLADAQYSLAQIRVHGAGSREPDEAEARRWLLRAARQNYDTAQLDLGTWLVEGRGGDADPEQGFAWLKRAAEGGNVAAQNRLAKLYRAGVGTRPDTILAAAWYMLARRAGLEDLLLEDFLHGLTEEQLAQAATRADSLR